MNYAEAKTMWETTRKRKLANNTYLEKDMVDGKEYFAIVLHGTEIIKFYPDKTVLDSGGWRTVTTKERLNRFTQWGIWQENGVWYINKGYRDNNQEVFADGMYYQNDKWHNTGPKPEKTEELRKQARQYAKDFVTTLFEGKVPKPSGGDCWYCGLVAQDGKPLGEHTSNNHVLGHMKEKYYVPSLCINACKMFGVSKAAWRSLGELWNGKGKASNCFVDVSKRQIESAIRRYCYRQLKTTS